MWSEDAGGDRQNFNEGCRSVSGARLTYEPTGNQYQ